MSSMFALSHLPRDAVPASTPPGDGPDQEPQALLAAWPVPLRRSEAFAEDLDDGQPADGAAPGERGALARYGAVLLVSAAAAVGLLLAGGPPAV